MRTSLLVILVSLMSLTACYKKPAPASGPVAVNIQLVKSRPVFYFDRYPANITALSQVDLRPQVQGYITGLSFTEGEHVQKGQALYEIDRRLYQESYDQAKANLEVALGNLKQAQQDADRYTYLNNYDAVAKQILDHAAITLQNAKNTVNAAEQTLKMAETNLNYSIITAPFEGTIGFSQVKLGNMVTVGQTVLNTVSTDDPMGVDFLISEKQLDFFNDLKRGRLHPVDSLFTIILPNDSVYPSTGKISVIDRAVDPQSGTIRVRVVFPNPDHTLRPGTSCILRVHNQETGSKLVIPGRALVELMGEYFVYVVKDTVAPDPADSTKKQPVQMALQKKVQPGQTIEPNVIVLKGLHEGERIVVDGVQSLHTGSLITVSKQKEKGKGQSSHQTGTRL